MEPVNLDCQVDQYALCSKIRPQQFFVGGPTNEDYPEKARKWRERSNGLSRLPFRPFLEKLNDEHSKKYPIPKSPTGEIMKRICSYKAVDSTHTPSRAPQSHRAEFFCNLCREEGLPSVLRRNTTRGGRSAEPNVDATSSLQSRCRMYRFLEGKARMRRLPSIR